MPIPDPVQVEDGQTPVSLGDMQDLQAKFNILIAWLREREDIIDGLGQLVTEQFVRDLIQEHSTQDADVHGANGPNQRLLKAVGGGGFMFADRNESEVPVGVYDNDIRIAPPA